MKISDSEMEIMNIIWETNDEVTSSELAKRLENTWKPTTVMTFLKRLCDKGALFVRRQGKTNFYRAAISEDDYKRERTEEFLKELHNGSVTSLLAALVKGQPDGEEFKAIKQWFNDLSESDEK